MEGAKTYGRAIFARVLRSRRSPTFSLSPFLLSFSFLVSSLSPLSRYFSRGVAEPVATRQVTARNTTVRCGHLSLSRVVSRNKTFPPAEAAAAAAAEQEGDGRGRRRKEEGRGRGGARRATARSSSLAVGCRECSRIDCFLLHRIGVCSVGVFLSLSLFLYLLVPLSLSVHLPVCPLCFSPFILPARPTHSRAPALLYLSFTDLFRLSLAPRPIYLPPRVAEWILFVSHRYFSPGPLAPRALALQNCLAATIYVSSGPAAD